LLLTRVVASRIAAPPRGVLREGSPGTQLDAKGAAAGFVVMTPQGVRGGDGSDEVSDPNGLAQAASAAVGGAATKLLPKHRWSNATVEGDRLHAVEGKEEEAAEAPGPPDDVAFLYAAAACVRDSLRVPLTGALFAAGWSQGGKLASALACIDPAAEKPGRRGFTLSAVAVGAGLTAARCNASRALPLLMLQGGDDKLVPFCRDGAPYEAGAKALAAWASTRACPPPSAWPARCGAAGDGKDALRLFAPDKPCAAPGAAPLALYWLPQLPHNLPSGKLPGLTGDLGDLFVGFFKSVVAGGGAPPEVAPLRSAALGEPPLAPCDARDGPCGKDAAAEKEGAGGGGGGGDGGGPLSSVRSFFNG
jgi:poly(3-hydroxybutyrate) depolymerase